MRKHLLASRAVSFTDSSLRDIMCLIFSITDLDLNLEPIFHHHFYFFYMIAETPVSFEINSLFAPPKRAIGNEPTC